MSIHGYIDSKKCYWKRRKEIHSPLYNYYSDISDYTPKVYNSEGNMYDFFFLRDIHSAHAPYEGTGKYFIFDRYNYGLKTHFYSHKSMLETMGKPIRKYGMFVESRAIVPKDYDLFKKYKGLEKEFDVIFTFDDRLLNEIENAKFMPWAASPWYQGNGKLDNMQYIKKSKGISFLCSNKIQSNLHRKRLAIAQHCFRNRLADVYGKSINGEYVLLEETLQDYRYSFAIENIQSDYYFSEKITNCFAAQTIPIYFGARKISNYFNEDGIIFLHEEDFDNIENIIFKCTTEEYDRRKDAILDNYNRVLKYLNIQDYLYEHYIKNDKKDV